MIGSLGGSNGEDGMKCLDGLGWKSQKLFAESILHGVLGERLSLLPLIRLLMIKIDSKSIWVIYLEAVAQRASFIMLNRYQVKNSSFLIMDQNYKTKFIMIKTTHQR
jgi:hypothetical protein